MPIKILLAFMFLETWPADKKCSGFQNRAPFTIWRHASFWKILYHIDPAGNFVLLVISIFLNLVYNRIDISLYISTNTTFGKILVPMSPNTLGQSDLDDIRMNYISRAKWWNSLILACRYKFMEIEIRLKNIFLCMIKDGCGHSGHRNLKLAVSQKGNQIQIHENWWPYWKRTLS